MNKMKIPKITWAQNDEYILLDIHLDKSDNEIKINENNIFFKQGEYCCDLNLFDNIIVNESKYSEKRIYEFKLKKQNNDEWKQLLLNKNDYKANISVNWDKWDEEIDEDEDDMMGGGMSGLEQMMAGMGGGSMPNMEEMMSQINNENNSINNQCMPCSEQNPNEDNDNDDDNDNDEDNDEDNDKYINIDENKDNDEDKISDSSDSSDKSLKTHNWDEYENKRLI